jgi:N-acetylglutamate synthase-like GNAT family acetyltransferase
MGKDNCKIKEILFNSKNYFKAVELRNKILRMPLGLMLDTDDLSKEDHDYHLGCFEADERIIGVLVLTPLNSNEIKMRQVAVDELNQNQGIGKMLVRYSEELAVGHGFKKIVLSARKTALDFYLSLGYSVASDEYIDDVTKLAHYKMEKILIS